MSNLNGKIALVTGASRGVGAEIARLLAESGCDVIINYRSKRPRAEAVAESVRSLGRRAVLAGADLTDAVECAVMLDLARAEFGRLDLLVLNASGGLEKDKAPDYAMELNLTAQARLADLSVPIMSAGGRIVFVTSHLAHFHGEREVYNSYEPVAASKKAGEDALRRRIPELANRGISLVVVSGDLIEGTITPRLMERLNPGMTERRRAQAGTLPTVETFARAIVDAAGDEALESGATVFVGAVV